MGFMHGSINVDVQAFCEKFFFYGGLIWLMVASRLRLGVAATLVAALLFVTSWIEIYLPGRSADITATHRADFCVLEASGRAPLTPSRNGTGPRSLSYLLLSRPRSLLRTEL